MLGSGDGKKRDVVRAIDGAGWDFNMSRHPYYAVEAPLQPFYTIYNRRHMTLGFDNHISTEEGYWLLRQKAAVLNTGELPLQFRGPDAERLLDYLFTKDITKLRPGRCGYGLACYDDGGLIVDGVLLRLADDLFWYVQADGDFLSWAKAHARGMDVEISDPQIYVSQMQGPASLDILAAACDDSKLPEPFGYFGIARVRLGGQEVVITRTGYTNELGWEYYTEPHHDAHALWAHLEKAGAPFGMTVFGLDSMHIRRIEAGILNANSDFDATTTPFAAGLGHFVDMDKDNFVGKAALETADRSSRLTGIACPSEEPVIGGAVLQNEERIGRVTAGAFSPFLKTGVGIALFDEAAPDAGTPLKITCIDGALHAGQTHEMPFYDAACQIPRGKLVDIPKRT
ncbi:MAG: aminomethyltransferase family protein [Pseudomonadota bacterium]